MLVLAVPRRHQFAGSRTVIFGELGAEPFVLYEEGSMLRELTLATAAAASFTVRSTLEASGNDTVRAFVAAGVGVSLCPDPSP